MTIKVLLWIVTGLLLLLSVPFGDWLKLWLIDIFLTGYLWFALSTLVLFLGCLLFWSAGKRHFGQRQWVGLVATLTVGLVFYGCFVLGWYVPRWRETRLGGVPLVVMTYNVNYALWDTKQVVDSVQGKRI